MVDTPKTDHWQDIVLTPTGVNPGSYNPAQITVGEDGRLTAASNAAVAVVTTISTIAQLPTIIAPGSGDLAIVLDDGSGNEQMYVWNTANADVGAPLNRWKLLATTSSQTLRIDYRQDTLNTGANQTIDVVIPDTGFIKEISVEIIVPYSGGTSITIQDNAGSIYMPSTDINPLLAGLYKIDLSTNLSDVQTTAGGAGQGQMRAIVGGAPGVGSGAVYIEWSDI